MDENMTWAPELVPLDLIDSNPWQGRLEEDALHVKALAEDIAENTLLQPGLGRRVEGRVQLAFAHSRLAAFKFLDGTFGAGGNGQAGELYARFPIILRELSDRQMSDYASAENGRRKNLTAIETAMAIQKRMADFGLTQLEAGRPFGYTSQGSVANLLRLLDLPEVVRHQVQERVLPERMARALVPFVRILPDEVAQIATEVAGAPDGEREEKFDDAVSDLLDEHGEFMSRDSLWPFDWQAGEAVLDGQTETLPKCQTCDYRIELGHRMYCTRKVCFQSKSQLWIEHELARLSKELGLPIGKPDAVKPLDINWRNEDSARGYLKRKNKPDLYLLPGTEESYQYHYWLLKCNFVVLGSTNPHLFDKKEPDANAPAEKPATSADAEESPVARAKRIEAEEQQAEERREARSAIRKARQDLLWLIFHTAEMVAPEMQISGGIVTYCAQLTQRYTTNPQYDWDEYKAAYDAAFQKKFSALYKGRCGGDEREQREFILVRRFANEISGFKAEEQFNWTRGCEKVKGMAGELGLGLPSGWDQPPIHKTATNCHVCGTFTPGNEISGKDRERGWENAGGAVTCSVKCREKLLGPPDAPKAAPKAQGASRKAQVAGRKSQAVKKSQAGRKAKK